MLIYDGDCGFCTQSARWLEGHLPPAMSIVPWQQLDPAEFDLTVADVASAVYWVDTYGRTYRGHRAIARALTQAGGWLSIAGWTMLYPPGSAIAAVGYAVISRYRHVMPGATEACDAHPSELERAHTSQLLDSAKPNGKVKVSAPSPTAGSTP